ncbi:MAG: DUF6020 family protein [Lachnospiraceae bacterium]|nr:DUF6020 family protein [Lachnospiraceae bacterium]
MRKRIICAAGFALPLSLCLVLGYQLETAKYLTPGLPVVAAFVLLAAGLTALTAWSFGLRLSGGRTFYSADAAHPVSKGSFLRTWLCIAVPNFVVLLGVYPGFFVYDAQDELVEVVTRTFNTHHPLFHVLALGGTITGVHKFTGSWNFGIFVYLFLQMLFITAVYAFVIERLRALGLRRPWCILFTVWYAFFPTVVMYTLCSTKDGLFSAFATLYVLVCTLYMTGRPVLRTVSGSADSPSASRPRSADLPALLWLTITVTLMMLLRNNASYVMVLFAFLLGISMIPTICRCLRRKTDARSHRKQCLISIVIISFVIYFILQHFLIFATRADHSEHQEKISVAIQSLGRVYTFHPEAFTDEDREILFSYLPEEGLHAYELQDVDNLKATFNNARYAEDRLSFWRLWWKTARRYPGTCLTSWLLTSYGMWYPFAVHNVYQGNTVFTFTYTESSYFGYETEQPGVRMSLIPPIDALYRWFSLDATIQRIPFVSLLFSPGFWFWFYAWFAARKLAQKKGSTLLPLIPFFLLWLTYLIGPYALVRYALPFFTTLPVLTLIARQDPSA